MWYGAARPLISPLPPSSPSMMRETRRRERREGDLAALQKALQSNACLYLNYSKHPSATCLSLFVLLSTFTVCTCSQLNKGKPHSSTQLPRPLFSSRTLLTETIPMIFPRHSSISCTPEVNNLNSQRDGRVRHFTRRTEAARKSGPTSIVARSSPRCHRMG